VDKEWITKYSKRLKPINFDMKTFFCLNKPQLCTLPLLTCMFYWANFYVFHQKLKIPALKTRCKGTNSGLYQYRKDGDIVSVNASSCTTIREIWDTLLHELVHAYTYRINWLVEKNFDPASGGHGRTFMAWKGPLKEIAGSTLTHLHDLASVTVEEDANKEGEKEPEIETDTHKGKPVFQYILLCKVPGKKGEEFYASKSKDLDKLSSLKTKLRGSLGLTATFYTRQLSNAPLLNAITTVQKGTTPRAQKTNGGFVTLLTESVFNAVLKAAKPLE
jgi:hypothetical protein